MSERAPVQNEHALAVLEPTTLPTPVRGPRLGLPTRDELTALMEYGSVVAKSGLFPNVKSPEAAIVMMRYGHQLGIDEFTALQNMYMIGGKPAVFAALMQALIQRDHGGDAIRIVESSAEKCVLSCARRDSSHRTEIAYTFEEAKVANLTGKEIWKAYPADMLFARCVSRAGRQLYRDTTLGLYTPEEVGGDIIEVQGQIVDFGSGEVPSDERTGSNNRFANLHRIGGERGLDHDDLHRIALFKVGKDLGAITATMLRDLEQVVEQAADADIAIWATDWVNAIGVAEEQGTDALVALGERMKAAGINRKDHKELALAYKAAVDRLASTVGNLPANASDEPVEAEYLDVAEPQLPGMTGDPNRFGN